MLLTQDYLKSRMDYNALTGIFTWKTASEGTYSVGATLRFNILFAGKTAGSIDAKGYVIIQLCDRNYKAHQLAFLYMTGVFPKQFLDHIDGIKGNNVWTNIREASRSQNQMNRPLYKNNTSGVKGVYKTGRTWEARINSSGVAYGKCFMLKKDAVAWRLQKEQELHAEFAYANRPV